MKKKCSLSRQQFHIAMETAVCACGHSHASEDAGVCQRVCVRSHASREKAWLSCTKHIYTLHIQSLGFLFYYPKIQNMKLIQIQRIFSLDGFWIFSFVNNWKLGRRKGWDHRFWSTCFQLYIVIRTCYYDYVSTTTWCVYIH